MLEIARAPFVAIAQLLPFWLLLGACVGSFLSMVAHRLPLMLDALEQGKEPGLSLSSPGSSCAHCGTPIRWYHNVPFLGFLLVRRATPCCQQKLPWRYLGFEVAATAWSAAVWLLHQGSPLQMWAWAVFGWVLLVAAAIDARTQWLPDALTLLLLWAGLVYGALGGAELTLQQRVLGAAVVYAVLCGVAKAFRAWRGVDGIGGGDLKLLAALAVWLPPQGVAYVLLVGSLLQIVWMLAARSRQAAFGPALCAAGACVSIAFHLNLVR